MAIEIVDLPSYKMVDLSSSLRKREGKAYELLLILPTRWL